MPSAQETLRRLTIGDRTLTTATAGGADVGASRLDELTESLIRVAVLVPLDAPQSSYQAAVEAAIRAGATLEDLLAALLATNEAVGVPRLVAAAPRIALAAGYDVEAALEQVAASDG
jgi:alkylhydroperoxidase/carboxymuconolactone decarboxylase family protein YurZ